MMTTPDFPTPEQLETIAAQVLAYAAAQGASSAETAVHCNAALTVTIRLGDIETLEQHRTRGLGVTVYFGQRKGSASTSDWQLDALHATVQAACDMARYTAEDPHAGLAEPALLASEIKELYLDHPWPVTVAAAMEQAILCESQARAFDPRICNSEGASVTSQRHRAVYANSHGFCGGYTATRHSLSCSVIAQEADSMQRDGWYTVAREATALQTAAAVGRYAAQRAIQRLGSHRLRTRQVPVLFTPEMARGLISHFISAIRGPALYRRSSFLLDKIGEQIFPSGFYMHEEPHLPKGLGSAPFDSEGVATRARALVADGILQGYVLDSYSGRRLGMPTTGNAGGIHNVIVMPGQYTFESLIKQMDTGLIVTRLMGQGVNLVTGDYSRGATGLWVEHGEIAYPVEKITIASQLPTLFAGIQAVGKDVDQRGVIQCGSLLIENMTVAGQ